MKIKSLITLILCAVMFSSFSASAKNETTFLAYLTEEKKEIVLLEAKIPDGEGVLAIYDENDILIACETININDGLSQTKIAYPDSKFSLKLYYNIGSDSYLLTSSDEIKPYIKEEQKENEDVLTVADLDSLFVVLETGKVYDEENDIVISYVDGLYRGKEITVKFEENYPITNASQNFLQMVGQSVETLKKGDILTLQASLSGRLTGVTFIFRAPDSDAITDNEQSHLFVSGETSVFGLIADKLQKDTIVLYDETGLESNAEYIEIGPDTNVYIYDRQGRNSKPQIATRFEILKSELPGVDFDDNDNIINWTSGCSHNYAYVRLYDGEVYDIVVYENY